MEFGLLGPLEVRSGEGLVRLGGAKQRALLALLLLHENQVVPRERLIDALWGETPTVTATKAIQLYVSQLRKVLPKGMLVTRQSGYVLEVEPEAVDLRRFERLVDEARGAEPARAASLLREALALWRGAALAGLGDEPFVRVEAARLEELGLTALEARIEADLVLGRHSELIGELEGLIALHPHREFLRGQLMLALYRSGRQAEALEAYRGGRDALAELGLEPGAALRGLERQILTQDPALEVRHGRLLGTDSSRVPLPGALVPTPAFPFVGRTGELALLRSLLDRAANGEGAVALIAAEAGGGKTRLVRELAHEAAAHDTLVLYGASDAAVSVPYQPLREWLEFALRVCDPEGFAKCLGDDSGMLSRLVPGLAPLAGVPADPGEPETDRYLLRHAATELLRRLARLQPLLLVADDIHWSDAETLRLLSELARRAPEARMLVLATYRDRGEELEPAFEDTLADLLRVEGVTRLSLGRLTDDDVGAFISASTDTAAPAGLASELGQLTGGTPLLLCELWRDLRERGAVEFSPAGVHVSQPLDELRGPERLRDILRQRVSRLAPETAAMLDVAAVSGPRFELPVVAEAAGLDRGVLTTALDEAVRKGLVEELPEPASAWRFTHELVRRAVYDRLTGPRRLQLHLLVGEALEHAHGAEPTRVLPELAHHFTIAAAIIGPERGVDYNLRAADAAIGAAGYDEAAARLSTALGLGIGDRQKRARTQIELAYVLRETGQPVEAETLLAASLELEAGQQEGGRAAFVIVQRLNLELWDASVVTEDIAERARDTLVTLAELGDLRGLAEARRTVALAARVQGRLAEAGAELERALTHAKASGDRRTLQRVTGSLAFAICDGPTPVAEAIRRCEELSQASRHSRMAEAIVDQCLGALVAMAGRPDEAAELIRRSSVALDGLGAVQTAFTYRSATAAAKELLGDRAGAEQDLEAGWNWFRELKEPARDIRAMQFACLLALLYCDDGRWDDAARVLEHERETAESAAASDRHEAALRLAVRARLATHRGELADAVSLAERAVERADTTDLLNLRARLWLVLAEVRRADGGTAGAEAAVAEARRLYEAKGNVAAAASLRAAATT